MPSFWTYDFLNTLPRLDMLDALFLCRVNLNTASLRGSNIDYIVPWIDQGLHAVPGLHVDNPNVTHPNHLPIPNVFLSRHDYDSRAWIEKEIEKSKNGGKKK